MNIKRNLLHTFFMQGIRFECIHGCTKCCQIPGKVFFTAADVRRLALFFGMSREEVIAAHLKHFWGDIHELKYPEDKPCEFLRDYGCSIYDARPSQCRTFPFWPDNVKSTTDWASVVSLCPGVGKGRNYSPEEIISISDEMRDNPFI